MILMRLSLQRKFLLQMFWPALTDHWLWESMQILLSRRLSIQLWAPATSNGFAWLRSHSVSKLIGIQAQKEQSFLWFDHLSSKNMAKKRSKSSNFNVMDLRFYSETVRKYPTGKPYAWRISRDVMVLPGRMRDQTWGIGWAGSGLCQMKSGPILAVDELLACWNKI